MEMGFGAAVVEQTDSPKRAFAASVYKPSVSNAPLERAARRNAKVS